MKMKVEIFIISALLLTGTLFSQNPYTGPATSSISGGAQISTGTFDSSTWPVPDKRIHNIFWSKYNPDYIDDKYNNTKPAAPAGSNEILDPGVMGKEFGISDSVASVIIDFMGIGETNSIPPDPVVAVGPNHIVACVNTVFAIFDKQGNEQYRSYAASWFNNVVANNDAFDPQIIYDQFEDRWVQLWVGGNLTTESYYLISVSDDSDPNGVWYNYAFPGHKNGPYTTSNWPDYPKLGYDQYAIYMSGRMFSFSGFWQYSQVRWVSKSELYSANGSSVNYTDIWDIRDPNSTSQRVDGPPVAAVHLDSSDTGYLIVDSPYTASSFVTLWKIKNHFTTPIITATNISTTAAYAPFDGSQLGGGQALDVGRRVYRACVYQDGSLWAAENARMLSVGSGTSARYIRLDVNSNTLLEDYAIGANYFYYLYPDIIVDEDNNMVMVYTRTGTTEYAGFGYTGRKDDDPAGYLAPTVFVKEGEANYVKTFGGDRNRWGDYLGIAQDPANRSVMWALVEYAESPSSTWGTWIAAFTHSYSAYGIVQDATTLSSIEYANLEVVESGKTMQTDSTGEYSFGSPTETVNIIVSAFAYQDTTVTLSLTKYTPYNYDIQLYPEIEAVYSGQVVDSLGTGVYAKLKFYAEGNPYSGPYVTAETDNNGFFSVQTIIGNYDIEVFPESPYAYQQIHDLTLTSGGLVENIVVNPAEIMLVDDDKGQNYEEFYFVDLQAIGKTYYHWDVEIDGVPMSADRNAYPDRIMFWFTGDSSSTPLTQDERTEILDHVTTGGRLYLTGQDIAEMNSGSTLMNTLGVDFSHNSTGTLIFGVAGDEIGNSLVFNVAGYGGSNNQTSADVIQITDSSTTATIFHYGGGTANPAGAKYESGTYMTKAVFLGFGSESINDAARRQTVLTRVYAYLTSPLTGIGEGIAKSNLPEKFDLFQNYPNPFNPVTTIEYDVSEKSNVTISIFNNLGQKVKTIVNSTLQVGHYKTNWTGIDNFGNHVSSGIYYYQMTNDKGYHKTRKLLLLK